MIGDPSRIRTCNPRSRNPLLYPVELWDRRELHSIANMKNPLPRQVRSEPFFAIPRQSCSADHCFRSATPARLRRKVRFRRGKTLPGDRYHETHWFKFPGPHPEEPGEAQRSRASRRMAACTAIARGHPSRRIACAMLLRMRSGEDAAIIRNWET